MDIQNISCTSTSELDHI